MDDNSSRSIGYITSNIIYSGRYRITRYLKILCKYTSVCNVFLNYIIGNKYQEFVFKCLVIYRVKGNHIRGKNISIVCTYQTTRQMSRPSTKAY